MKQTRTYRAGYNRYRIITDISDLPANAIPVSDYCKERGCTNPYIYELFKKGKADFEIVIFKGINFVIPLTNN